MPHAVAGYVTRSGERRSAGDLERRFPLASVTKLLAAYAVLVAVGAQFLIDSVSRLRATSAPGAQHGGH